MWNILIQIIDYINIKNVGGRDFQLLLWWIAVLFGGYALYKLTKLVYEVVPKLFFVVIYGALYYFHKVQAVSSSDSDDDEEPASPTNSGSRIHVFPECASTPEDTTIIIAVDATDKRAGGLLILPKKKLIYFYSIDWPASLNFQKHKQPDKFEMLNAYIALQLFEEKVEAYRKEFGYRWEDLAIKCDNSFCANPDTVYLGNRKNAKWRELFCIADTKLRLKPYSGRWIHEEWDDPSILMADKLSRVDCSSRPNLPKIRVGHHADHAWELVPTLNLQFYPEYSNRNLSMKKKTKLEIYNTVLTVLRLDLVEIFNDIFSTGKNNGALEEEVKSD